MKEVTTSQELNFSKMLDKIREIHIDVIPIIQEELEQILPQYIEQIVKNLYNSEVKHE